MKKKFLSLMMAAAVVATTSVSAFAAEEVDNSVTGETTINNVLDSSPRSHEVTITGKVQSKTGEMPATNFKVTVPTAANFTVTSGGRVVGPDLKVKNEGSQTIEVHATDFYKETDGKLKVVGSATNLANEPRTTMSLRLTVNGEDKVYLGADGQKSGVFPTDALGDKVTDDQGKLLTLAPGVDREQTETIQIKGSAGTGTQQLDEAATDTFKLVLKIKKASVN